MNRLKTSLDRKAQAVSFIFKVTLQVSGNCLFLQDIQKDSEATEGLVQQGISIMADDVLRLNICAKNPAAYIKIGYFENDADLIFQDEIHGNLFGKSFFESIYLSFG